MPSCTIEIKDGMKIDTKNMNVSNARKDVLDMLLINHPLDCPVWIWNVIYRIYHFGMVDLIQFFMNKKTG